MSFSFTLRAAGKAAFIDLLDDAGKDVVVSMNGSLSGQWSGSDLPVINGTQFCVSAALIPRAQA